MVTLTNPVKINDTIGGTTTLSYDVLRVVGIFSDPVTQSISAQVQLRASANAAAPLISGTLAINTQGSPSAVLSIPNLGVFININISGAIATIQGWIAALQNAIESGLVSTGTVVGTQSAGI